MNVGFESDVESYRGLCQVSIVPLHERAEEVHVKPLMTSGLRVQSRTWNFPIIKQVPCQLDRWRSMDYKIETLSDVTFLFIYCNKPLLNINPGTICTFLSYAKISDCFNDLLFNRTCGKVDYFALHHRLFCCKLKPNAVIFVFYSVLSRVRLLASSIQSTFLT